MDITVFLFLQSWTFRQCGLLLNKDSFGNIKLIYKKIHIFSFCIQRLFISTNNFQTSLLYVIWLFAINLCPWSDAIHTLSLTMLLVFVSASFAFDISCRLSSLEVAEISTVTFRLCVLVPWFLFTCKLPRCWHILSIIIPASVTCKEISPVFFYAED